MEEKIVIKYYLCEESIVVRVIEHGDDYGDSLEYYDPRINGWIPDNEWYKSMFLEKVINFREISKKEAEIYMQKAIEYCKRLVANPIYLRLVYGLDLDFFNEKTGEWQAASNDWYKKISEYPRVSKKEVDEYIKSLYKKR